MRSGVCFPSTLKDGTHTISSLYLSPGLLLYVGSSATSSSSYRLIPAYLHLDIRKPQQVTQIKRKLVDPVGSDLAPTRSRYAWVRVVDAGVRTPWPGVDLTVPPPDVQFRLTYEPLVFGLLPQILVPAALFILPVIVLAIIGSVYMDYYLNSVITSVSLSLSEKTL
jgi:hypothetical protein